MAALATLVLVVLAFAASWWALRFVAGALGAGNNGWGACFLAMIVPSIVGGIVAAVAGAMGLPPLIAGLVAFVVQVALVAKFLETDFLRAFAISLVASIVVVVMALGGGFLLAAIFGVGLAGVAGLMGAPDGMGPGTGSITSGSDSSVVIERSSTSTTTTTTSSTGSDGSTRSTTTTRSSTSGGNLAAPRSSEPEPETASGSAESTARTAPAQQATKRVVYGYRDVAVDSLGVYVKSPVRVLLEDGRKRKGKLIRIGDGDIEIRHQSGSGSMDFTVRKDDIKRIEVYARTQ